MWVVLIDMGFFLQDAEVHGEAGELQLRGGPGQEAEILPRRHCRCVIQIRFFLHPDPELLKNTIIVFFLLISSEINKILTVR